MWVAGEHYRRAVAWSGQRRSVWTLDMHGHRPKRHACFFGVNSTPVAH